MSKQQADMAKELQEGLTSGGSILDRIGRESPVGERRPGKAKRAAPKDQKPIKVSLYLYPQEVNALDAVISKRRQATGRSPRRTYLIREAIQAWLKQEK